MKRFCFIALAVVAVATGGLWAHSMFAYVGVGWDVGRVHVHAASYQGRMALVVGGDAGLLEEHCLPPHLAIRHMTATHQAYRFCDWTLGGYGVGVATRVNPPVTASSGAPATVSTIILPHWAILLACLVVGAPLFVRYHRRAAPQACPACGYDLRGTAADRPCPECGREQARRGQPSTRKT